MEAKFKDFPLRIVEPSFGSPLTNTIIELERLRAPRRVKSRVHPAIFAQLKEIFHTLESLGSVRIEGNNTTLSDVVEKTIDGSIKSSKEEAILEFMNTQRAIEFIEGHVGEGTPVNRALISELHKITVADLDPTKEGDHRPGRYRDKPVSISKSKHKPPEPLRVPDYMEELIAFINIERDQKYKLLSTAVAHHRFAWTHPFENGNGRTVRLLTYAMLMSQGFAVNHILNPTAVFCNDREEYYAKLSEGDKGTDEGVLIWCQYVLDNLLEEIKKIDRLLDYDYLVPNILIPALNYSVERKTINQEEYQILKLAAHGEVKAGDVNKVLQKKYHTQVSAFIGKLKKEGLLADAPGKQRSYVISFTNNQLLRGVIDSLRRGNFIGSLE